MLLSPPITSHQPSFTGPITHPAILALGIPHPERPILRGWPIAQAGWEHYMIYVIIRATKLQLVAVAA